MKNSLHALNDVITFVVLNKLRKKNV